MKVFISHSSTDKKFVRTLKYDLKENGIETFVDEDSLEYGDSLVERLELAIDTASHFVIIISPNSVESDWVKLELKRALRLYNKKTLSKIIPIKYRECEIPIELQDLLYADLSNEVVKTENNQVKFLGDGYEAFLIQLIKTIKSAEKKLSSTDKKEIKREGEKVEKLDIAEQKESLFVRHKIVGYARGVLDLYKEKVKDNLKGKGGDIEIYPILLPPLYRFILKDIKIGDVVDMINSSNDIYECRFAGFRKTDDGIVLNRSMREVLNLDVGQHRKFLFNFKEQSFKVIEE